MALIASLTNTDQHFEQLVDILAPQGKIALIDDPVQPLNPMLLKPKSASLHWEAMFARSSFQTPDMIAQHDLLDEVAGLIDTGVLRTTLDQTFGTINATNLKRAHALIESGNSAPEVLRAIDDMGYRHPTPIQEQAIPVVLMTRDVLGVAQTGTGKTASFTLPMMDILAGSRARARMPRSLILEPTRELALQVAENFGEPSPQGSIAETKFSKYELTFT